MIIIRSRGGAVVQGCDRNVKAVGSMGKNYYHQGKASRGAGAQSVTVNRLVVGSIPIRRTEIFIYIYVSISSLWCLAKRGLESRHLPRKASRTRRKVGNGVS